MSYSDARAKKNAYNRDKGVERLRKAYAKGTLTKDKVNRRGYNKFLDINKDITVTINEDKILEDAKWDGLKGYVTNTNLSMDEVIHQYHGLWVVESFRDSKQYAGITNCQSTDFRKLAFHFNASLTAINLAKAACKRMGIPYSISSCKSMIHNAYMLERFICVFGIQPDTRLIDKIFKELILFTARAA